MRRLLAVMLMLVCASAAFAASSLNGAGATFPYPIYSKWFSEYNKLHPEVQINYQSIGSGGGIAQLKAGTVDFGASDMPLNEDQLRSMPTPVVQIPTVLGAVVPVYNLPELKGTELKFTPQALAGIFLGTISSWNDKAIASANPGVNLPNKPIIVIRRSDGSGTTFVFTDFLSKVSPDWKSRVGSGTSVNWPVGLGGKGNEGVAGQVRQMDGAIGYVELIYALQNRMSYGSVKNAGGEFVKASLESTTAAAASLKTIPKNFVGVSITNAGGKGAYPIASFTYLLVPKQWKDAAKGKIMTDFLTWMLNQGQGMAQQLNYAPLPQAVEQVERTTVSQIK